MNFIFYYSEESSTCLIHAAFVPLGTILNLIKRIQLIAIKIERCTHSMILPSPPVPSEEKTGGGMVE